jgi:hypothetical protein
VNVVLAAFVVLSFAVALERFRITERARAIVDSARDSLAVFRDPTLDDAEKERLTQKSALSIFALTGTIAALAIAALLAPLAVVWILDRAGLAAISDVFDLLESPLFLLAASAVGVGAFLLSRAVGRR